jgi:rhamnogalacturonan endolyase
MIKLHLTSAILLLGFTIATAQDPIERTYMYPVLKPDNEPKPKVTGWAKERVTEKLNRGLTVQQTGYLGE